MGLSNYGYGLSDNSPGTPWNEPVVPEKEFDVCISQTLSKSTTVTTDRYQPEYDEETGYIDADTSDTDWKQVYNDCAMTPLDIINACEKIAKALLEQGQTSFAGVYLKSLVKECDGWCEDELEVIEE